ncbi:MAG: DUF1311 domain-containing protein [Deltaproteobacteria bacterium]|nr:DUF1311 domain-containing protein [Deltaproteobacteria bacterium]
MKSVILILLGFNLVVADDMSIADEREKCEQKSSSTAEKIVCINKEELVWDSLMNRDFKRIMNNLSADEKAKFRNVQKTWLAYRDAIFEISKIIEVKHYGKEDGSLLNARIKKDIVKYQSEILMSLAADWE